MTAGKPSKAELLLAAAVLADMILNEWGGPLSYAVKTWGCVGSPEQARAVEKLEVYLDGLPEAPNGSSP